MNGAYIDTNIFIYLSQKNSPFYSKSQTVIKFLKNNAIPVLTSTETIQEIIHFSQNIKNLSFGIRTARQTLQLVDLVIPIDNEVIKLYLDLVVKHKNIKSRDSLHVASCINNNIKTLITYDTDFKRFKEIVSQTPAEFLKGKKI